jgi:hypothetical protein
MDIQVLGSDTLKIKIKKATIAVDPKTSIQKFDADAILLTGKEADVSRVNSYRVVINGAGEYEVSGLKIVGIATNGEEPMFVLNSDNANILLSKASSLRRMSTEKVGDYKIVVINADAEISESIVTAMEPNIVILYGEKAREGAKALGKEGATSASKINISEDKLPEEMDVMLLR